MPGKLLIDYYHVSMPDLLRSFDSVLLEVQQRRGLGRNLPYKGDVFRLHTLSQAGDRVEGDMTRLRMDEIPPKGNLAGDVNPLGLGADEGIGEQCAFLYHLPTQVLVLQRNRYAMSANQLAFYFGEMVNLQGPITLDLVLQRDAVQRLARMEQITRFRVQFARVHNPEVFAGQNQSTTELIDILRHFRSPSADISISMGHERGSLPVQLVKGAARGLARIVGGGREHNDVTKIEVSGRYPDRTHDVIDLIQERLSDKARVDIDDRTVRYAVRRAALRAALDRREQELTQMFQQPRGRQ